MYEAGHLRVEPGRREHRRDDMFGGGEMLLIAHVHRGHPGAGRALPELGPAAHHDREPESLQKSVPGKVEGSAGVFHDATVRIGPRQDRRGYLPDRLIWIRISVQQQGTQGAVRRRPDRKDPFGSHQHLTDIPGPRLPHGCAVCANRRRSSSRLGNLPLVIHRRPPGSTRTFTARRPLLWITSVESRRLSGPPSDPRRR
jgi:hypothetical protein